MTNSDIPAPTKQPMPFESLMVQSRGLICERLAQALAGMLDKVEDTPSTFIDGAQDGAVRAVYSEAKDKALAQREIIEGQFRAHYLREFRSRSNRMKTTGQSFSEFDSSVEFLPKLIHFLATFVSHVDAFNVFDIS